MKDRIAVTIATALGCGYAPIAPGTAGSAFGVLIYIMAGGLTPSQVSRPALLLLTLLVTFGGVWAANRAVIWFRRKDPGQVVIDEVAGQLVTFTVASWLWPVEWGPGYGRVGLWIFSCFFFFRLFDVIKPFPVRRLERLPSGTGVVADDLLAGVYAGIANQALWKLYPAWN
ncbi:MAG: phosphatidylglycerophosphatase A [Acidobacteria bacterium]|nr:phosphatidylglycerophosphatase A [Acidobacteriota bacterium]